MISLFFSVLTTVFVAEMGDKTQLMLVAMSAKKSLRDIILGTAAAILVLNGIAVAAGGVLHEFLSANLWIVRMIAAAAFLFFSATSLKKDDGEENAKESKFQFAPLAVFCTFFAAELGDKTQLAAITFGAANGLNKTAPVIWLASSIGLFAADIIGLLVVKMLGGKTPDFVFNALAFVIFAVFGFLNLAESLYLLFAQNPIPDASIIEQISAPNSILVLGITAAVFAVLCILIFVKSRKSQSADK